MAFIGDNTKNTQVKVVVRDTASLAATATTDMFSVSGLVEILGIYGEVTTIIQTQANATKLEFDPDSGAANADMCDTLDISADAVGTMYGITGTPGDAMISYTSGVGVGPAANPVLEAGDIAMTCAATNTGSVKWTIVYRPLVTVNGVPSAITAV